MIMLWLLAVGFGISSESPRGLEPSPPLVLAVTLDANWSAGGAVSPDSLPLGVRSRAAAPYRILENGEFLDSGVLRAGENSLRIGRAGLLTGNQQVVLRLEVEASGAIQANEVVVRVSGIGPVVATASSPAAGPQTYRLELRWQGRLLAEQSRVERPIFRGVWIPKTPMVDRGWLDPVSQRYPVLDKVQLGLGTVLRAVKAGKEKKLRKVLEEARAKLRHTRQEVLVRRGDELLPVTVELSWQPLPG